MADRRPQRGGGRVQEGHREGGGSHAEETTVPGVREQVSLRIDQDVLEYFREGGAGWQDRINEALRKASGK